MPVVGEKLRKKMIAFARIQDGNRNCFLAPLGNSVNGKSSTTDATQNVSLGVLGPAVEATPPIHNDLWISASDIYFFQEVISVRSKNNRTAVIRPRGRRRVRTDHIRSRQSPKLLAVSESHPIARHA